MDESTEDFRRKYLPIIRLNRIDKIIDGMVERTKSTNHWKIPKHTRGQSKAANVCQLPPQSATNVIDNDKGQVTIGLSEINDIACETEKTLFQKEDYSKLSKIMDSAEMCSDEEDFTLSLQLSPDAESQTETHNQFIFDDQASNKSTETEQGRDIENHKNNENHPIDQFESYDDDDILCDFLQNYEHRKTKKSNERNIGPRNLKSSDNELCIPEIPYIEAEDCSRKSCGTDFLQTGINQGEKTHNDCATTNNIPGKHLSECDDKSPKEISDTPLEKDNYPCDPPNQNCISGEYEKYERTLVGLLKHARQIESSKENLQNKRKKKTVQKMREIGDFIESNCLDATKYLQKKSKNCNPSNEHAQGVKSSMESNDKRFSISKSEFEPPLQAHSQRSSIKIIMNTPLPAHSKVPVNFNMYSNLYCCVNAASTEVGYPYDKGSQMMDNERTHTVKTFVDDKTNKTSTILSEDRIGSDVFQRTPKAVPNMSDITMVTNRVKRLHAEINNDGVERAKPKKIIMSQLPSTNESSVGSNSSTNPAILDKPCNEVDEGPTCDTCQRVAARFLCSGCRLAAYCSRECQAVAWMSHQKQCIARDNVKKLKEKHKVGIFAL